MVSIKFFPSFLFQPFLFQPLTLFKNLLNLEKKKKKTQKKHVPSCDLIVIINTQVLMDGLVIEMEFLHKKIIKKIDQLRWGQMPKQLTAMVKNTIKFKTTELRFPTNISRQN